jgi:hypothetical protein
MVKRQNLADSVKVGFTLTPNQVKWLNDRAASEDRSMSAVIRRLVDEEADRLAPVEVEGKS